MRDLEADIACALRFDLNVLVTGESGAGKTSIARRIYREGCRPTNGTIFVDDPERMSVPTQLRLLRVIEETTARGHRVRLITVTASDLFELVQFEQFCEPLFYRLNTIHLAVPPLRDRPEDIPLLLRYFLSLYARRSVPRFSTAAWQRLVTYAWPGNLRELRVVAQTLAVRELPRLVEPADLPPDIGW
jgi:two-component system nitrogen regulation response regulator NtrX